MLTNLLRKAVIKPVHPPIRRAMLFFIPPLQRRLSRTWRKYIRLIRRIRRLRRNHILRRRLKQHIWLRLGRLRLWDRRRGNRAIDTADQIHLVCPLLSHRGGGPQRALHLFDERKNHREVFLWSEQALWSEREPDPALSERYPVRSIVPERLEFPKTGTLVFVSSYFPVGPWVQFTSPRRIILVHNNNTMTPRDFQRKLRQLSNGGRREVEVMYASELTKRKAGNHPGYVQASLIDLDKFVPAPSRESSSLSTTFTVGRMSRA